MKKTHKLYTDVIAKSGSKNEPLEVTENGIYEAPKGTGYSPVNVNVPQTAESGTLKSLLDETKSTHKLFEFYNGANVDELIRFGDTSKVTDMSYMFSSCTELTSIPQLDTSKVTNMRNMFFNCSKLTTIPELDTSKVTNMENLFTNCRKLTAIPQLDVSRVTYMDSAFNNCTSLTSIGMYGFIYSISIKDTSLKHDALVAFLNQAGTAYNSSQTITMGSTKLALLSDEEKAIATNKGWQLA